MFEQLEELLRNRNYSAAGAIFSHLKGLLRPRPINYAEGFTGARMRVLPLEKVIRVYITVDSLDEWDRAPGHRLEATTQDGCTLREKTVELPPHFDIEYRRCVVLHFIHVQDAHSALVA